MPANERSPLLQQQQRAHDAEEEAQESAYSAIQGAEHGVDPNSSAFAPPPDHSHAAVGEAESTATGGRSLGEVVLVMSAMWIGTFLAALDGTIVATILGTVGSEFRISQEVGWLGTSYLLTQTAFQPLYGRLSDIFGRRPATPVSYTHLTLPTKA